MRDLLALIPLGAALFVLLLLRPADRKIGWLTLLLTLAAASVILMALMIFLGQIWILAGVLCLVLFPFFPRRKARRTLPSSPLVHETPPCIRGGKRSRAILAYLTTHDQHLGIRDLQRATGWSYGQVEHVLLALQHQGYIIPSPQKHRHYQLNPRKLPQKGWPAE